MKKPFNLRLPLFVALSLVLGIFCGYLFLIESIVFAVLLLVTYITVVAIGLLYKVDKSVLKLRLGIIIAIGVFLFAGTGLFTIETQSYLKADLNNHYYDIQGRVSQTYATENGVYLILEKVTVKGERTGRLNYKVGAYVNGKDASRLDMGHVVKFSATLVDYGIIYQDRFSANNISSGIKYFTFVDYSNLTVSSYSPTIFQRANVFLRNTLKSGLSEQTFPIAYALITGHDELIDADVLTNFRSTGLAHVFAVSGLHIGFVASLLKFILDKLKTNKWATVGIIFPLLLFYSGVCGFSSSSIRATIMCTVSLMVKNAGLKYDPLSSISISAIIILLYNPCELFCVGFQLSFAVVLGIILLSKPIEKVLKFLPKKFAQSLATVISAQLASIPVMLVSFGKISLISVACNLLFIPVVAVVYILTIVLTLIGGIFGIPVVTLWLLEWVFKGIVFVITLLDYSIFNVGVKSPGFAFLFYFLAIVVYAGIFNISKRVKNVLALALAIVFGISSFLNVAINSSKTHVYLSGTNGLSFAFITNEKSNTLIINDFERYAKVSAFQKIADKTGEKVVDNLVVASYSGEQDIQLILTKVSMVFAVKSIYYYGDQKLDQERAIKLSFKSVKAIQNLNQNQDLPIHDIAIKFTHDGYGVDCTIKGKKVLFLSNFGSNYVSQNPQDKYLFAIAVDYQERALGSVNAKTKISYLYSDLYVNAQSQGYLLKSID